MYQTTDLFLLYSVGASIFNILYVSLVYYSLAFLSFHQVIGISKYLVKVLKCEISATKKAFRHRALVLNFESVQTYSIGAQESQHSCRKI